MAKIEIDVIVKGDTTLKAISDSLAVIAARLDNTKKATEGFKAQTNDLISGLKEVNSVTNSFANTLAALPQGGTAVLKNMQQLVQGWQSYTLAAKAAAEKNGQTLSTQQLLGGVLKNMVSPLGLLSVGIGVATAAWTAYEMWTQKSKRAAEENTDAIARQKQELDNYIGSLDGTSMASAKAAESYAGEIIELNRLFNSLMDSANSREKQNSIIQELQSKYPQWLANLNEEEILANNGANAYARLSENIKKSARAKAGQDLMSDALKEQIKNEVALKEYVKSNAKSLESLSKAYSYYEDQVKKSIGSEVHGWTLLGAETQKEIGKITSEMHKYGTEIFKSGEKVKQFQSVIDNNSLEEQSGLIYDIRKKIDALEATRPFLKQETDIKSNIEAVKKLKAELDRLQGVKKESSNGRTSIGIIRSFADVLKGIYNPENDAANLIGLKGLEKDIQKTKNRYTDMIKAVNEAEKTRLAQAKKNGEDETKIRQEAADKRKQITDGMDAEISNKEVEWADKTAQKLAELEAKAGITKLRSRERDLEIDNAYWDEVVTNAKEYGLTLDQINKLREKSQATINVDWDAKMFDTSLNLENRLNETKIEKVRKAVEEEYKAKEEGLKKFVQSLRENNVIQEEIERQLAEAKLKINNEYQEKIQELALEQSKMDIITSFDGNIASVQIAALNEKIKELRLEFHTTGMSIEEFFSKMSDLSLQKEQVEFLKNTYDQLTAGIGNAFSSMLLEGEDFGESMKQVFKSMISAMISELVRLAAVKAITAIFTGGTSGVFGFLSKILGFSKGGYTGSIPKGQVAGLVHGQEYVFDAQSTRRIGVDNLKALQMGRVSPESMYALTSYDRSIDVSGLLHGTGISLPYNATHISDKPQRVDVVVHGEISGDVIKLVNDEANRSFRRFYRD